MAGTSITHQIDDRAVSNLLQLTTSGRKLAADEMETYNRNRCSLLNRSATKQKRQEHLRFRSTSKEREEMRLQNC